jgi:predicted DsbA family dithiol-disulfide isomerase
MHELDIEVWSDVVCPWCYVGKRRLEGALATLGPDVKTRVVWRAFELDDKAPRVQPKGTNYAERLAKKYATSLSQAEGMITRMMGVAKEEGIEMRYDRIQSGNTFDAHRLLRFALTRDPEGPLQSTLKERLFRGYFTEGEAIGEVDVLVRLGAEIGLPETETRAMLESDAHSADVRADEDEARELGITGVPFFAVDARYAIPGAQSVTVIRSVLDRALSDAGAETHGVA